MKQKLEQLKIFSDKIEALKEENQKRIEELKEKLNLWMEEEGYFPSVIRCDRYGNAYYYFEVT